MNQNSAQASYRYSLNFLSQLAASGVWHIVASPGFRNSPLLLAAHRTPGFEVITVVDERGAGFLALGLAKATDAPVALLCTSGTAVGNYLPAVMEANHSQVPLIVVTADRPQELVGTGANQCTDQGKIFGDQVRLFLDTAPPTGAAHEPGHAAFLAGRIAARARMPIPGPVHVNLRFREPFLPSAEEIDRIEQEVRSTPWGFLCSESGPSEQQALAVASMLKAARRPAILLGPAGISREHLERIASISAAQGIPVLAEVASGIGAIGETGSAHLLLRVDSVLEAMSSGAIATPDLFIRIGAPLTGRPLSQLLAKSGLPQLVFEEWGETREPGLHPSVFVEGGLESWLLHDEVWTAISVDAQWVGQMEEFERRLEKQLDSHLDLTNTLTEWHFQRALEDLVGHESSIFVGNSMAIRDFNSVFSRSKKNLRIFSNRGLSGIDGLIASATGVALGSGRESHALLGDLSTLHDLPSLAVASSLRERLHLTIWVMNNGGGEIFRIVQTAKAGGDPAWFTTPQEYDLAALAKTFRIPFARVTGKQELDSLKALATEPGLRLVEVLVDRETNLKVRRSFRHGS
jgi:2-succinyl-5-enolpyruvyl-6-hydroxy-3-cyclohexene-1-carboxylate synthase